MRRYGFGVDIGGTTCKIGFFDGDGMLLDKWEIKTNTECAGVTILDDIVNEIENKLMKAGISKTEVLGIGIGVPGPVMADGTVNQCVNLGWGAIGVWIAMFIDWAVRSIGFVWRMQNGKWKNVHVI